jgi:hypothetical protein
MACSGSCIAQIVCAIAVAVVPYLLKSMVEGGDRATTLPRPQQVYHPAPPQRFCRALPDGRQCCCVGQSPRLEVQRFHMPYGTRVRWRAWCP